jgi:Fic family protein
LRRALAQHVAVPRRWLGSLRRLTIAKAVQGSNSIEGYDAELDDVLAVGDGDEPLDATTETYEALRGYQTAMTYVLQLARDEPAPVVDESMLRSLHFMMLSYDLSKRPGLWRPGSIWVERDPEHTVVYEAPPVELLPTLLGRLIHSLAADEGPAMVRAAMAHLNLVMIHPYSDGNGRMARCLQTLVLARDRVVAPEFSSIEEYLGAHTRDYYEVLADVGQGAWNPERDATPWVRFCLDAHEDQAARLLQRLADLQRLWEICTDLATTSRLPARCVPALVDAARGFRLRNQTYRRLVERSEGEAIAELTATRDLKAMVQAGLIDARGERRGRIYVSGDPLRAAWADVRGLRPRPTAAVQRGGQQVLFDE